LPPITLIPRTDDALGDASPDVAALYEIRDLHGDRPGADCATLLRAALPRIHLRVVR
jgi:hypothetical protein